MRLTTKQQHIIKQEVKAQFGDKAKVWLFGSRTDDSLRGGDIDLYIQINAQIPDSLQREMRLYANLIKKLGDQRIDIITHQMGQKLKPIYEEAQKTGVQL